MNNRGKRFYRASFSKRPLASREFIQNEAKRELIRSVIRNRAAGLFRAQGAAAAKVIKPQSGASPLNGFAFSFVAGKIERHMTRTVTRNALVDGLHPFLLCE